MPQNSTPPSQTLLDLRAREKVLSEELAEIRAMIQFAEQRRAFGEEAPTSNRFAGTRFPFDAIVQVLSEHGGSLPCEQVIAILIDGGIQTGKDRQGEAGKRDIRNSITTNVRLQKLVLEGNILSLPSKKPPASA